MNEVGYRMGTVFAIAGLGTLTSPPIGGAIAADSGGKYDYAAVFSGVNYMIGLIGMIFLRGRVARWKVFAISEESPQIPKGNQYWL